MKQKIVCLFVFVCCVALLLSAKHLKGSCVTDTASWQNEKENKTNLVDSPVIELSPLFHLVFKI